MGLAITKDLIELHGGTMDIISDFGEGTTVIVQLPEKMPESKSPKRDDVESNLVSNECAVVN